MVCLNRFNFDTEREIEYVRKYVENMGVLFDISECFAKGSLGGVEIAKKLVELCNQGIDYKPLYDYNEPILTKIERICHEIYHAGNVKFSDVAMAKIKEYEANGFTNTPICIAKTQYSLTDNQKVLGAPEGFTMTVTDVRLSAGAGFIVCLMGDIMTMPGLSKDPAYRRMKITPRGKISGIY